MAPQTRKSIARAAMTFLFFSRSLSLLSDQLRPGLLCKIGYDWHLAPARNLASLASSPLPEPNREWQRWDLSLCCNVGDHSPTWSGSFPADLTNSAPCVDNEAPPHSDPLADLLNSGGSFRHPLFTEKPCDRGESASSGSALSSYPFSAHRVDLCGGSSLCGVVADLNRVDARHREFLRLRIHLAQAVDSLGPSSALPDALPLVCRASPFPATVSTPRSVAAASRQLDTPSASK